MKYTIYFEIYGKKLKTTLEAESEKAAEYQLRCDLKVLKIVAGDLADKDVLNNLQNMFNMSG